jgi:hypothetical protein
MLPKPSGAGKQLPVFQFVAKHGVSDVVGGEGEAIDLDQQRIVGQLSGVGDRGLDEFAVMKVIARDDEVGGVHGSISGASGWRKIPAAIFACSNECFATAALFKTSFV